MARTCFIICPIGDEGSEVRNDADLLADYIIVPVLGASPFNMEIRRADKLGQPGFITNQIVSEIEKADLVIADLSRGNPNVFYEIAIRHVTRKPYVHMIARGERIPFDNAPIRAIDYDLRDLRSVQAAKEELEKQATAALNSGTSESPVSIALTIESLRVSGNAEQVALADFATQLSGLTTTVQSLASQIAAQSSLSARTGMFGGRVASGHELTSPALAASNLSSVPAKELLDAIRGYSPTALTKNSTKMSGKR